VATEHTIILRPNKTYPAPQCRKARIKKYTKDGYPVTAIVEVTELKTPTSARPKVRRYLVQQDGQNPVYKINKPEGKVKEGEDAEYYVGLREEFDGCSCIGFLKNGFCTHTEALRGFCTAGVLPGPRLAPRGAARG
jgi:hypothetical protein